MTIPSGKKPSNEFVHDVLFYHGMAGFLQSVLRTIRAGLYRGDPVLVAVPLEKIGSVRAQLGSEGASVRFVNMTEAGRNPSAIIANVLIPFSDANANVRVCIVGEPIWPGRSSSEYATAVQHEALINLAFRDRRATIVCPYDAASLDPAVLHDAMRTHPKIVSAGERWDSLAYGDPAEVAAASLGSLPEPGTAVRSHVFDSARDLPSVRNCVTEEGRRAGMDAKRIRDLRLAVNEVVTNTLTHTAEPGRLRIWRQSACLVCDVRDTGRISDPLVGRRRVPAGAAHGHGLLLVNSVCDLVQIASDRVGTTVRLHMRCDPRHEARPVPVDRAGVR